MHRYFIRGDTLNVVMICILSAGGALLLFRPDISSLCIQEGLNICAKSILPSLFPYFILTNLWCSLGYDNWLDRKIAPLIEHIFHLPSVAASPLLLGSIGGFPLGGQCALHLYEGGRLSRSDTEQLLFFCSNAGPAFIFGVVGNRLFQSVWIGGVLWLIHLSTAMLLGVIFRPQKRTNFPQFLPENSSQQNLSAVFTGAVADAGKSVARVCLFVLLFGIITGYIKILVPQRLSNTPFFSIFLGTLELAGGINLLVDFPQNTAFVAAAGLLAWNGACVHFQVLSVLGNKPISLRKYYWGKLLHVCLSIASACCIAPYLPLGKACTNMHPEANIHLSGICAVFLIIIVITKTATGKEKLFRI